MVSAWTIGTSKRPDLHGYGKCSPGPGAYSFNKFDKKIQPKWKFGTSGRKNLVDSCSPGPGSYE